MGTYEALVLLLSAVLWAALLIPSQSLPPEEVDALEAFRNGISDDSVGALSLWRLNHSDPCGWFGVHCSDSHDHVIALELFNLSLGGFLSPKLGSLSYLQKLNLSKNKFTGVIPNEIGLLKRLTELDLSNNILVGQIPHEIGDLTSSSKIYFDNNELTGSLPLEIGNLTNLVELRLDRNKLQGRIPASNGSFILPAGNNRVISYENFTGLCLLRQLKVGNFSYNLFTGKIPPCLNLPESSFQGNCFQDKSALFPRTTKECELGGSGPTLDNDAPNLKKDNSKAHSKHHKPQQPLWLLILEIITGAVLVVFTVIALVITFRRFKPKCTTVIPWKRTTDSRDQIILSVDGEMLKHVLRLSRQELEVACEDFSNIIGSSSHSEVYKGTMRNGPEIAVVGLCVSKENWPSYHELCFQREVVNLARLNHENTSKLLGYCQESSPFSRMLVFEYASNGTLYEHLHYGEECQLSWSRRMKIAIGIACGLRYLHTELQPPFCLSGLHSSTVYLTEDFSPKLVDFESWKSALSKSENCSSTNGGAFLGYGDSKERRHIDIQANTHAFGVLLLEIISGKPPYCKDKGCLVDWAMEYLDVYEKMCHLIDPELRYFNHDDLRTICSVVSLCVQPEPSKRPSMQTLTSMLENGIDTSAAAALKESSLAWAELALSP